MRHVGHFYYVGFLSAARLHGASHQVPMVLQVVTPALLRDRVTGRNRIEFIRRSATRDRPTTARNVPTGRVAVSTPEVTVLDLVGSPEQGGGLGNVATANGDLLHEHTLRADALSTVAGGYPVAVAQRAGHLVAHMANELDVAINLGELERVVADAASTLLSARQESGMPLVVAGSDCHENSWRFYFAVWDTDGSTGPARSAHERHSWGGARR